MAEKNIKEKNKKQIESSIASSHVNDEGGPKNKMYDADKRSKTIVRASVVGIATNLVLTFFKAMVGMITGSIAITLDAVNNLSDALSSLVTIIGTKLASKEADREHPLGHGRVEYIASLIIAIIILYAGISSMIEAIKKIIRPVIPNYTASALVIIGIAVITKIILGSYVKKVGVKVNSGSLTASGKDALLDALIAATTLFAAVIYITTGKSIEAYLAAVISLVIIKAGFDILKDTLSKILGERVDSNFAAEIKKTIASFDGVHGAYDLVLHNYGPDTLLGSVHIEVPDTYTADMIDDLTRHIMHEVFVKHKVVLSCVGIYSMNTSKDNLAAEMKTEITEIVMSHEEILQMHGFYLDEADKMISLDIIVSFDAPDRNEEYEKIYNEVHQRYPDYELFITLDVDISE